MERSRAVRSGAGNYRKLVGGAWLPSDNVKWGRHTLGTLILARTLLPSYLSKSGFIHDTPPYYTGYTAVSRSSTYDLAEINVPGSYARPRNAIQARFCGIVRIYITCRQAEVRTRCGHVDLYWPCTSEVRNCGDRPNRPLPDSARAFWRIDR